MPFKPSSPETKQIGVVQQVPENTFHMHEIHTYLDPNDPTQTRSEVVWSKGYKASEPEAYNPGDKFWNELQGSAFLQKMMETPFPVQCPHCEGDLSEHALTYYDVVKRGYWEFLQEQGTVPEGEIE